MNVLANPQDIRRDIGGRTVRGGAATMAGQSIRFLLQLGSVVILARLLTPTDYGLVGMVTAITGFLAIFSDLGLSAATVQREQLTHEQVTNLFWINQALGWGIAVALALGSPLVAWIYHDGRLVAITIALACAFPLGSLAIQHRGLLQREMRFGRLAVVDVLSLGCGVFAALALAWLGAGYWALVGMPIATAFATAVLMWVANSWRPSLPRKGTGIRPLLSFGGNLSGFSVVNYLTRNLDNVLIGWAWGPAALGFYIQAYRLLMLPLQQINGPVAGVIFPALSRLQSDPERFAGAYIQALRLIAWVTMPAVAVMVICSEDLVLVVYGPQWLKSAVIFKILGVVALLQPVGNTVGWVFLATGRTRRMFFWGIVALGFYGLAFSLGLPYGAQGVALAYGVMGFLLFLPSLAYAFRGTRLNVARVLAAITRPAAAAVLIGLIVGTSRQLFLMRLSLLPRLGCEIASAVILVALAVAVSKDRRLFHKVLRGLIEREVLT